MMIRVSLAALCAAMLVAAPVASKEKNKPIQSGPAHEENFACSGILGPDSTEAALRAHYGDANVVTGTVYGPEGMEMLGTSFYPGEEGRSVEVLWYDEEALAYPASVTLPAGVIAPNGVRLGMTIDEVEALNGQPFKLGGFWWDYGGYAYFEVGNLADNDPEPECFVSVRFLPGDYSDEIDTLEVSGEVEVRSDLPLLDEIDTRVFQLLVHYPWPDHLPEPEY